MVAQAFSCRNAFVEVAGTQLFATRWSVRFMTDDIDTSNTRGGGFMEHTGGLVGADISIDAIWTAELNPLDNPPFIRARAQSACKLFTDGLANVLFNFTLILITEVNVEAEVHDVFKYTIAAKSHGPFTYPAGVIIPSVSPP